MDEILVTNRNAQSAPYIQSVFTLELFFQNARTL